MASSKLDRWQDDSMSVPTGKLCSLGFHIRIGFKFEIRRTRTHSGRPLSSPEVPPPPYSSSRSLAATTVPPPLSATVHRRGPVRVSEFGRGFLSAFFKAKVRARWLELTDTHLLFHPSAVRRPEAHSPISTDVLQNKTFRVCIVLSQIDNLQRIQSGKAKSHCLLLETASPSDKKYLLAFRSDEELCGWQHAILRDPKPPPINKDDASAGAVEVSAPWGFSHNVHVGVDSITGSFTSLPLQWQALCRAGYECQARRSRFRTAPIRQYVTACNEPEEEGKNVVLRITIAAASAQDTGHVATTLSVPPSTTLRTVLKLACRKAKVNANGCALVLMGEPATMEDTVRDLRGQHELVLLDYSARVSDHERSTELQERDEKEEAPIYCRSSVYP